MKINILCDNKIFWFWKTSESFLKSLDIMGHSVNVCQSESELKEAIYLLLFRCNKIVSKTGLKKYIKYCLSPIQPSERKRFFSYRLGNFR